MASNILFNATLAYRSIRTNKLRTGITVGIIALGITALVGILTAIEGLKSSIYSNFSDMGANTFQVSNRVLQNKSRKRRGDQITLDTRNITYKEALAFKRRYAFPSTTSLSLLGTGTATVKYNSRKTNPNITVMGIDEDYTSISSTDMAFGRNFSAGEIESGSYVCILGSSVAYKLFNGKSSNAINAVISVGPTKYRVVGVAASKGSSMVSSADNTTFVPLQNARAVFGGDRSFVINVKVLNVALMDLAADEAEGLFRVVRGVPLNGASNFTVDKNDSLVKMVLDNIKYITWAALFIGIITLMSAAIGLMNIMLVSVAERTREIGVNKALGAMNRTIKSQFLTESVLISIGGGVIGTLAGILIGNGVSALLHAGFIIPWLWILVGLSLCTIVGLLSGVYPAAKAARLDPIVALRYE